MKKCLLVGPRFSEFSYWNYVDVCHLLDARYPAAPLGLVTLAALLPRDWDIRLLDCNAQELDLALFDWADIVMAGGMIPQQRALLALIELAHGRGKPIALGGPDPTSQPDVYGAADYLVLDEAEMTIPLFLADLAAGATHGVYRSAEKPDLSLTPAPRYDLLDLSNYLHVGVQFSRGCPFDCEFCDIIELYGRRPRTKGTEQVLKELDVLYGKGYRGHVDFVDDNFIGNKRNVKRFLPELAKWSREHDHPFYFSTEASLDLADDLELLGMMQAADFRYVFIGIETPEKDLLLLTQKKQNTRHPLGERIARIYQHGMIITAGFIVGFDTEKRSIADAMVNCIEETSIAMAMVGLLAALPNTQLTRRLAKEGRMLKDYSVMKPEDVDQATSGLNFVTSRPRVEILEDYASILSRVYAPKPYFRRVLATANRLGPGREFRWSLRAQAHVLRLLWRVSRRLGFNRETALPYWRTLFRVLSLRPRAMEGAGALMAMYIHFRKQTAFVLKGLAQKIERLRREGEDLPAVPCGTRPADQRLALVPSGAGLLEASRGRMT